MVVIDQLLQSFRGKNDAECEEAAKELAANSLRVPAEQNGGDEEDAGVSSIVERALRSEVILEFVRS